MFLKSQAISKWGQGNLKKEMNKQFIGSSLPHEIWGEPPVPVDVAAPVILSQKCSPQPPKEKQ